MYSEGYSSCLVCLRVCLSAHAILAVRTIKSITKDTIVLSIRFAAILKLEFFLKLSYSKVRAFFLFTSAGRPSLVGAYSACIISYTLRYMFAYA